MRVVQAPIEILAEEVARLRRDLALRPQLRQGVVTAKVAGPPMILTVVIGEGTYPDVRCVDSTVVNGETVWVLILPGGTRIALGDIK